MLFGLGLGLSMLGSGGVFGGGSGGGSGGYSRYNPSFQVTQLNAILLEFSERQFTVQYDAYGFQDKEEKTRFTRDNTEIIQKQLQIVYPTNTIDFNSAQQIVSIIGQSANMGKTIEQILVTVINHIIQNHLYFLPIKYLDFNHIIRYQSNNESIIALNQDDKIYITSSNFGTRSTIQFSIDATKHQEDLKKRIQKEQEHFEQNQQLYHPSLSRQQSFQLFTQPQDQQTIVKKK